MSVNERMKQLQQLNAYISSAQTDLKFLVERLGWSLEYKPNKCTIVQCPRNAEHLVPADRLDEHIELCTWRSEGYYKDDIPLPDGKNPESLKNSIVIDNQLANTIIQEALNTDPYMKTGELGSLNRPAPQTADRIISDFTTDERRAIYDFVVSKSETENVKLEDLNFPFLIEKKGDQPKSLLEVLAAERDAKRRRISHRAKKVSTNRKSHIEIMREVIQNQMELYQEWLTRDENSDKDACSNEKKTIVLNRSRDHEKDYKRKLESPSLSERYRSRENVYDKSQESKQSQRNYRHSNDDRHASTSRDKSSDRDRSKRKRNNNTANDRNSSQRDNYRNRSRESRDDCRSMEKHKTRMEGGDKEKRDKNKKSYRDGSGNDYNRTIKQGQELTRFEKRDRHNTGLKADDGTQKIKDSYARSYASSMDDSYKECQAIKTEKNIDQLSYCGQSKDNHVIDKQKYGEQIHINNGSSSLNDTVISLRDLPNEWSEDSEKNSQQKRKKRKSKKEKRSKQKRKKHSKKSKHSLSSDSVSDFSC